MPLHHRPTVRSALPALLLAAGLALAGCSESASEATDPVDAPGAVETDGAGSDDAGSDEAGSDDAGTTYPTVDDLPSCAEIRGLLGPAIADLEPLADESEDGTFEDALRYGVTCSFFTEALARGEMDIREGGAGLVVGITINREPDDEQTLRDMGMVTDDPRLESEGGYIVYMGGEFDPAEPLGIVGPAITLDRASYSFTGGDFEVVGDSLADLTGDWAIDASLELHESVTD